jgi:DNA-directed RNA polymerase specialized sigma24 family protein
MRTEWTCRGCDSTEQERLHLLWKARQAELKSRLPPGPDERAELQIVAEQGQDRSRWNFRAALFLPDQTCVAQAAGDDAEQALGRLVSALGDGLEVRAELAADGAAARPTFHALEPLLEGFARAANGAAFLALLRPVLKSLNGYVRRELRILASERALPTAQVTAADVLDEVLVRAWERFERRPRGMKLDVWVVRLIDECLDESARGAAHESIQRRMPLPSEEPHSSWDDTWVARAGEPESIGFAELLPGRPGIDLWDRLDGDVRQAALAELLGQLSRPQRQALIFHAVEGYDPAEIADLQDRPLDDVLEDIATARQILWHQTAGEDDLSDIEQRFSRTTDRPGRRRRK